MTTLRRSKPRDVEFLAEMNGWKALSADAVMLAGGEGPDGRWFAVGMFCQTATNAIGLAFRPSNLTDEQYFVSTGQPNLVSGAVTSVVIFGKRSFKHARLVFEALRRAPAHTQDTIWLPQFVSALESIYGASSEQVDRALRALEAAPGVAWTSHAILAMAQDVPN